MKWKISSKYLSLSLLWSEIKWNLSFCVLFGNVAPPAFQATWQKLALEFFFNTESYNHASYLCCQQGQNRLSTTFYRLFNLACSCSTNQTDGLLKNVFLVSVNLVSQSCWYRYNLGMEQETWWPKCPSNLQYLNIFFFSIPMKHIDIKFMHLVKKYIHNRLFVRKLKKYSYI